jgi:NAD(P)-dependent dehydrogenase (short-subunit alcohol dehydrogenase family)
MKTSVVTGAAGALGGAVARALSARGDGIVLVDREGTRERLGSLARELGRAVVVTTDRDAGWADMVAAARTAYGAAPSYAALIAGGWDGGKPLFARDTDGPYRAMIEANVDSVYYALRALLPAMVDAREGAVVVIGSRNAVQPGLGKNATEYTASKAAVVALAQAAAAEVLEYGVRINAVLPSTLDTPANRAAMPQADASRWVALDSAAATIRYLLSADSRDVSGAALPLYGRA